LVGVTAADIRIARARCASVMKNLLVQYAVVGQSAAALPRDGKPFRYYFFKRRLQEACQPPAVQKHGHVSGFAGQRRTLPAKRERRVGWISTLGTGDRYPYAHARAAAASASVIIATTCGAGRGACRRGKAPAATA
jgi:hypothetical protein